MNDYIGKHRDDSDRSAWRDLQRDSLARMHENHPGDCNTCGWVSYVGKHRPERAA